jgi:hypothetical protein
VSIQVVQYVQQERVPTVPVALVFVSFLHNQYATYGYLTKSPTSGAGATIWFCFYMQHFYMNLNISPRFLVLSTILQIFGHLFEAWPIRVQSNLAVACQSLRFLSGDWQDLLSGSKSVENLGMRVCGASAASAISPQSGK